MHALSIWQPWASLIVAGKKRVETRSWRTRYRGPLLVHASRNTSALEALAEQEPYKTLLAEAGLDPAALPLGAVIGSATLAEVWSSETAVKILSETREGRAEFRVGDFSPGRFGWFLADAAPCEPYPVRGERGLFQVTPKE